MQDLRLATRSTWFVSKESKNRNEGVAVNIRKELKSKSVKIVKTFNCILVLPKHIQFNNEGHRIQRQRMHTTGKTQNQQPTKDLKEQVNESWKEYKAST